MKCKVCNTTVSKLYGGKCNRCLCKEAIEDSLREEAEEAGNGLLSSVNTPITPGDYIDIVQMNAQIDWKSYIR